VGQQRNFNVREEQRGGTESRGQQELETTNLTGRRGRGDWLEWKSGKEGISILGGGGGEQKYRRDYGPEKEQKKLNPLATLC